MRPRIDATYTTLQPSSRNVGQVPYLLASKSQLRMSVDRWIQETFDGANLTVDQAAFAFRLTESRGKISVNLSESGAVVCSQLSRLSHCSWILQTPKKGHSYLSSKSPKLICTLLFTEPWPI